MKQIVVYSSDYKNAEDAVERGDGAYSIIECEEVKEIDLVRHAYESVNDLIGHHIRYSVLDEDGMERIEALLAGTVKVGNFESLKELAGMIYIYNCGSYDSLLLALKDQAMHEVIEFDQITSTLLYDARGTIDGTAGMLGDVNDVIAVLRVNGVYYDLDQILNTVD